MRRVAKLDEPDELKNNRSTWEKGVAEVGSEYYKTRYRAPTIKAALVLEAAGKCVYCESKLGHNTPGDVEHKIPVSVEASGRFDWKNLTLSCTECNRRKLNYYSTSKPFIDPYVDDVESVVLHVGPCAFARPGHEVAEISVRILELGEVDKRSALFSRKVTAMKFAMNLMSRITDCQPGALRELLISELKEMASPSSEYSAMIRALILQVDGPWNP